MSRDKANVSRSAHRLQKTGGDAKTAQQALNLATEVSTMLSKKRKRKLVLAGPLPAGEVGVVISLAE